MTKIFSSFLDKCIQVSNNPVSLLYQTVQVASEMKRKMKTLIASIQVKIDRLQKLYDRQIRLYHRIECDFENEKERTGKTNWDLSGKASEAFRQADIISNQKQLLIEAKLKLVQFVENEKIYSEPQRSIYA